MAGSACSEISEDGILELNAPLIWIRFMAPDPLSQQKFLHKTYLQLTEVQRSLVQVFAVLYKPSARDVALKCWNAAFSHGKPHGKTYKSLDTQSFSTQVTQLIKQECLIQERGQGAHCPKLLIDLVVRDAVQSHTFEAIAQAIEAIDPCRRYSHSNTRIFYYENEFLRELRIAIYRQDRAEIDALFKELSSSFLRNTSVQFPQILATLLTNPFDPEWMRSLSPEFFQLGIQEILSDSVQRCVPANEAFDLLEEYLDNQGDSPNEAAPLEPGSTANPNAQVELKLLYAEQLWLRGQIDDAEAILTPLRSGEHQARLQALQGAIAFLKGQTEQAIAHYHLGLKAAGKAQSAQARWFTQAAPILFLFALLKENSPSALQEAETLINLISRQSNHWLQTGSRPLLAVLQSRQGRLGKVTEASELFAHHTISSVGIAALVDIYSLYWLDVDQLGSWLPAHLTTLYREATQAGYDWLALEIATLMAHFQPDGTYAEAAEVLREEIGTVALIDLVERKEAWELSLTALTNLINSSDSGPKAPTESGYRLVWSLQFRSSSSWTLSPLEQKYSSKGGWTKGKAIALKRLYAPNERPVYLTAQDRKICDAMDMEYERSSYYYGSTKSYYTFGENALIALVGHPLVFWEDNPGVRVDVVSGEPELLVKKLKGDRLRIELSPQLSADAKLVAVKETPTRLKIITITTNHLRIAEILGPRNQLEVPAQAQERVLGAIASVASLVTVQSDIGGGVAAEEVPSDSTPHVHLLPAGDGLKVSILSHPFPQGGSYYEPGKGGETVIAEVEGKRLQTQRNLKEEKQRAKEVITSCEVFELYEAEKGEWQIEAPSDCLELLLQLQELGDRVIIEWPEGEKFRVSKRLGLSDFKFNIHRQQDWFAASGEIQIGDNQVLDMQQLMTLLDQTPGRFVKLADGQFLALTEEFRKRLQTLNRLSERHGKGLRIHGLAALALEDVVEDVEQLKVDKAWKDHLKRIQAARTIEPQLPTTLNAELRDYQREGYTWLARLAEWGVGACLADDMGLGKTLQAIALILSRSSEGPTLVIAPTSVCMNWIGELERFAPSLRVQVFGSGDRQQVLKDLGPNDLLICSYGLLQQEGAGALLAEIAWQTIVLDEAQAIKNTATKRSQAAMNLQGNFKLITTGTPIENHLGELWNLFRFINPGLLGSLDSFNERFANPIERDQDEAARDALRRVIQPFMLRRTKDQVLQELPSRTEITLQVELSQEEMAFYEALRREAIAKLSDSDANAGQKHLQVLAEIMRLRRACCNTRLVRPEMMLPSTKLDQFGEILGELLDNGHKALVFSQFVDHLSILREYLDEKTISYQYLDGSTPAKERKKRVDAFQNGTGDVFLISLKAGGTGLNLTAADYVIHMDPWWNPAVEDQASDRAHRIGQQRPVTIYRLVAKGTIEDKIVALHKLKRDLADSLLEGTDMSSKVSTEELLKLIQQ